MELKNELIKWLNATDNPEVLYQIKKIKDSYTLEEQNLVKEGIERGLEDLKNGKVVPHEEVCRKYGIEL